MQLCGEKLEKGKVTIIMGICKICKKETSRLFEGICVECMSINAGKDEKRKLDKEHDITGLQINTPIGEGIIELLRMGQGNFAKNQIQSTNIVKTEEEEEDLKVIKMPDYINIVYRPSKKERFFGTIDLSKVDAKLFGISGDNVWFFNRLFVPSQIRDKGVATKLMQELVKVLDEQKIILICEVNPYGDLNEEQLKKLYTRYGFKNTNEGYMIYKK